MYGNRASILAGAMAQTRMQPTVDAAKNCGNVFDTTIAIQSRMLRIIQNVHASGAKSYYSTADYYSEGQELVGEYRGKGARLLGLAGEVDKASWDALCDNKHPGSGDKLTPRV